MFSKENLHHAYFIEGERRAVLLDIEKFLKTAFAIIRHGHPDVHYGEYESFGIDESRALQDAQSMKPVVGDKKIFIIVTDSITSEAQNALLKVFEEPTPGTHFFVISSSQRILLPTLRSRMVVVTHESSGKNETLDEAKKFIRASPKTRLEIMAPIIEEKDKGKAEVFLQALLAEMHAKKDMKLAKEILSYIGYLKDRSPSIKLILERVALLDL